MPVDPQIQTLLDMMKAANMPALNDMTVEQARNMPRQAFGPPEEVAKVSDHVVPGPAGDIPVRVYQPAGDAPFPVLVFFHGGGWVIGDVESYDATCRQIANASGCVLVSVEYRRAPEAKYPAAAEDAYAATVYVASHPDEFGVDAERLAVGGDSAGGNLAAVVSQMARDRGGPAIKLQVLVYPVTNFDFETASYRENAEGYLLTTESMRWFWGLYLNDPNDGLQPYASPLRASSLGGLPPAHVMTAEFDPLRDEGEAYAAALVEAGGKATVHRYDGMIHGFFQWSPMIAASRRLIDEYAAVLRQALGVKSHVA